MYSVVSLKTKRIPLLHRNSMAFAVERLSVETDRWENTSVSDNMAPKHNGG